MRPSDWKSFGFSPSAGDLSRAKVPGGWLVLHKDSITFVPDPNHLWDGQALP